MLKYRKILILLFAVLLFGAIALTMDLLSVAERPEKNIIPSVVPKNIPETILVRSIDSPVFREKLSQWVYDRSNRISKKTAQIIVEETFKHKHPAFLLAIMSVESQFCPFAKGPTGDYGLGQVVWETHKQSLSKSGIAKEARDLFDIEVNVRATSVIFNDALSRAKGDPTQAMKLYVGAHKSKYQAELFVNFASMMLLMES